MAENTRRSALPVMGTSLGPPLTALLAGGLLGLASGVADLLPWYAGGALDVAGPWLVVAFGAGAVAPRAGLLNGALALAAAVAAYYLFHIEVTQRTDTERLIIVGSFWMVSAVLVGGLTGLLGGWWAARRAAIPIGLLAGALVGESLMALTAIEHPMGRLLIAIELSIAAALPLLLVPGTWRRILAYSTSLVAAGVTAVAIQVVDEYLRTIYG